jgi:putative transposase
LASRCPSRNAISSTLSPASRNVRDHLPERDRQPVQKKPRAAWALSDHAEAIGRLRALADELARSHPGAAASLREGLEETVTITRLGIRGG